LAAVTTQAKTTLPVDPFANSPVVFHSTDPVVRDAFQMKVDTTLKIKGSGGMNQTSGRICPDKSSEICATIVVASRVAPGYGGTIFWEDDKSLEVIFVKVGAISPDNTGTLSTPGSDLQFTPR